MPLFERLHTVLNLTITNLKLSLSLNQIKVVGSFLLKYGCAYKKHVY